MLIISITQSFGGRCLGGFMCFPSCGTREGRSRPLCVTDLRNYRKENRKEKLPLDCAALCKGGRKNFLKSLLLGLIFKNYESKCLSTIITFCDNFSPCLFQPKIQQSDVYCTPITLLFVVLAWFKPPVIQ